MQVGSEFLYLCNEQVDLLTGGLGASLAIVALAERPTTEADRQDITFVPVVTYPEAFSRIDSQALMIWLSDIWMAEMTSNCGQYENPRTNVGENIGTNIGENIGENIGTNVGTNVGTNIIVHVDGPEVDDSSSDDAGVSLKPPQASGDRPMVTITEGTLSPRVSDMASSQNQMVMPLVYQDVMVGLLVIARVDHGWNQLERYDIERIAQTLAAACVLEQRSQWLEQRLHQQSLTYTQLHEQQQDILDDILHQFRNPLTALQTFGKLLVKRLQPADRNRTVAKSIVRESDRLQELLVQFKDAATLPSMALPTVKERIDPPDTVKALTGQTIHLEYHDLMDILTPLLISAQAIAQERGICLQVTEGQDRLPVWVDHKALREVLNNLIDNALKYTPAPGHIAIIVGIDEKQAVGVNKKQAEIQQGQISVEPQLDRILPATNPPMQGIAIIDTGPGIPSADQEHLFERHFRGVQSHGTIPGTGLGLAIAQFLIQQMGGMIQVFSPVHRCPYNLKTVISKSDQSDQSEQSDQFDQMNSIPETLFTQETGTAFVVWLTLAEPRG